MVERLKSCHIGEAKPTPSPRSGSLPLVHTTVATIPRQRGPSFTSSKLSNQSTQYLSFAPFMSMPWWTGPRLQLPDTPMTQNDMTSIQTLNVASNKRKREGEAEPPKRSPQKRSQATPLSLQGSNICQDDEMEFEPLDIFANSNTTQASANITSSSLATQGPSWNPYSSINPSHVHSPTPTLSPTKPSVTTLPEQTSNTSQQVSTPSPGLMQPFTNFDRQKQTVTVPARLVPEQSVSPRTQTVEIPRLPYANQVQARQMMLPQRATNASGHSVSSSQSAMLPLNLNNQFQIPRSVPPQGLFPVGPPRQMQNQSPNRPQTPQTHPSDIFRNPSLYKIPPWPSSPSQNSPSQRSTSTMRPPTPNANMANSRLNSNSNSGTAGFSIPQRTNMMHAQVATVQGMQNSLPQRAMPMTPRRTTPVQSQPRASPPTISSLPIQPQETPNKRKNSPNLYVFLRSPPVAFVFCLDFFASYSSLLSH